MGHSRPIIFPKIATAPPEWLEALLLLEANQYFPRNLYGVGMAADTWFEFTLSFPLLSTEVVT